MSLIYNQPESIRQAQFSMPFAVGCMLAYGDLGLNQLTEETLLDPVLQKEMGKVTMIVPDYLANDPTVPERYPEGAGVLLITDDPAGCQENSPFIIIRQRSGCKLKLFG